jgi:predicted esterase YcpF (UPF0227 family)
MILYLHGFRSSPQSYKTKLIAARMHEMGVAGQYRCPQLPPSPREAIALVLQLVKDEPVEELALIGSSLGGYYATWLAEHLGCRAVLLNPAVHAPRDLAKHVGQTAAYHTNEAFEFKQEYLDELKGIEIKRITRPDRYFLIAAKGDELLDWREMVAHFPGGRQRVVDGSDHGLSDFDRYMNEVLDFCLHNAGKA